MSIGHNTTFLVAMQSEMILLWYVYQSRFRRLLTTWLWKHGQVCSYSWGTTSSSPETPVGHWVIGGDGVDGRSMVASHSFAVRTLGLWVPAQSLTWLFCGLPSFQRALSYCAKISITPAPIQYENDDLMRVYHGDDYAVLAASAPCALVRDAVFGARQLTKCLLYAINGGRDGRPAADWS